MLTQPFWSRLSRRPHGLSFSLTPLLMLCVVVLLNALGSSVFAQAPAVHMDNGLQFSKQSRIGFHSGDDWEPSITADRFGHVYTLIQALRCDRWTHVPWL